MHACTEVFIFQKASLLLLLVYLQKLPIKDVVHWGTKDAIGTSKQALNITTSFLLSTQISLKGLLHLFNIIIILLKMTMSVNANVIPGWIPVPDGINYIRVTDWR